MKKGLLIIGMLLIGFSNLSASHIPGGNITWTCDPLNPLCYNFIFTQIINCPSTNPASMTSGFTITNSCGLANPTMPTLNQVGVSIDVAQTCATATSTCAGGTVPGAWLATYEGTLCLPADCDSWIIDYNLCCRDANSNTAGGSSNNMHLQSIMNTTTAPCNNGPVITSSPIPYMCANQTNTYCLTVADPDADSTYYQMTSPLGATGTPIAYNAPYSVNAPLNGFVLDPTTGCMTFNQLTTGNFVVAVMINSFDVFGNLISSVTHDYQFEIITCTNTAPNQPTGGGITNFDGTGGNGGATQLGPGALSMCYGDNVCFDVVFDDIDPTNVLTITTDGTTLMPGATFTQTGTNPATGTFCWTAQPGFTGNVVTFVVEDDACPIVGTNSFSVNFDITTGVWTGADDIICDGQTSPLIATGGSGSYTWSAISGPAINVGTNFSCNPCANPVASPTATTTYLVTSTLSAACQNTDTVTITVVPDFTPTITQSAASTCLFDPVQLNVNITPAPTPGFSYSWSPSTFLDFNNIANPLATITTPGTYTYYVNVTSPGGCSKGDSVTVVISNNVAPTFTLTAADSLLFCGQQTQFTLVPDTLVLAGTIDDFNGPLSANWQSVTGGVANVSCGSMTGNALHFDGTTLREAITVPQNVTSCTSVDFCLFMGNSASGGAPCENADANEDVELSYSVSGPGGPWILMQLFDSDDWDAAGPYNNTWTCFSIAIPPGAQTATTLFKWDQPNFSACAGCDNWALDDVSITCPSTTTNYNYTWTPGNTLDDDTIQNPIATPQQTTTYVVSVTDPNGGCTTTDSVTVFVQCGTCYPVDPAITNITCKDAADGSIIVTPNFVFASEVQTLTWTDSISGAVLQVTPNLTAGMTDSLNNLPAGAYTISMQDTSGCIADTTIWLTEPDSVIISSSIADQIICIGGNTQISATASLGNGGPYTYTWTDLNTGLIIPGNGPHTVNPIDTFTCYSAFATDPIGCISSADTVCVTLFDSIVATSLIANTTNDSLIICPNSSQNIDVVAVGGMGAPYTYQWYLNNVNIGSGSLINVTPTGPSTYIGVAYDNCTTPADSVIIFIDWYGLAIPLITKNKPDSCYPTTVEFTNASTPQALVNGALTQWSITNGDNLNGDIVSSTFDTPYCKDVTLTVTTIDGCIVDTTYQDFVCPYDYPMADFMPDPMVTDLLNTNIDFINQSDGFAPLSFLWNFNSGLNPDSSMVVNPTFVFPNNTPGQYTVNLTVTDGHGCVSQTTQTVIINGVYLFYVPNSFTPDGDGNNDTFKPEGNDIDLTKYTMQIFNRWGELIFETIDATEGWDGTYKGKPVPEETYIWKIDTKEEYTPIHHKNFGHVNLLR
jgi:gliding motility-associated-like protein